MQQKRLLAKNNRPFILGRLGFGVLLTYSTDLFCQVLEGKPIYADCFGNLVPLTKSGQHHLFSFYAFKENRLALFIKVRMVPCYITPEHKAVFYAIYMFLYMLKHKPVLWSACLRRSETTPRSHVVDCHSWRNLGTTGHFTKMPYATSISRFHLIAK